MTFQDSTPTSDRIFSSLVYLLPFFDSLIFGAFLFKQFHLENVFVILRTIYYSLPLQPFTGLIVFFLLLFAVVRNQNISRFIRFNTMQAILIDLILMLCGLILSVLRPAIPSTLLLETLYNTVFIGVIAALGYAIVQSLRGRYAEIPTLSDAVNMQVR